jgi:hypothetical protein
VELYVHSFICLYAMVLRQRDKFSSLFLCLVSLTPHVLPISLCLLCVNDDDDDDSDNGNENYKQQHGTVVII